MWRDNLTMVIFTKWNELTRSKSTPKKNAYTHYINHMPTKKCSLRQTIWCIFGLAHFFSLTVRKQKNVVCWPRKEEKNNAADEQRLITEFDVKRHTNWTKHLLLAKRKKSREENEIKWLRKHYGNATKVCLCIYVRQKKPSERKKNAFDQILLR